MTDADQRQALLNLVDPDRTEDPAQTAQLLVRGLAARRGARSWPTTAGWNLLGDAGRAFDPDFRSITA